MISEIESSMQQSQNLKDLMGFSILPFKEICTVRHHKDTQLQSHPTILLISSSSQCYLVSQSQMQYFRSSSFIETICICTFTYTYIYMCVYIYTNIYMCIYKSVYILKKYVYICVFEFSSRNQISSRDLITRDH